MIFDLFHKVYESRFEVLEQFIAAVFHHYVAQKFQTYGKLYGLLLVLETAAAFHNIDYPKNIVMIFEIESYGCGFASRLPYAFQQNMI